VGNNAADTCPVTEAYAGVGPSDPATLPTERIRNSSTRVAGAASSAPAAPSWWLHVLYCGEWFVQPLGANALSLTRNGEPEQISLRSPDIPGRAFLEFLLLDRDLYARALLSGYAVEVVGVSLSTDDWLKIPGEGVVSLRDQSGCRSLSYIVKGTPCTEWLAPGEGG